MTIHPGIWAAGLLGAALSAVPVSAHHSFAAQFDRDQPVSFTGVVTKVEWRNPHVWIYVDAAGPEGSVVHWEAEAMNPNMLARQGWRRDDLKEGDGVTVEGFRAHCCTNVMNARSVVREDGRSLFRGQAPD